jgi:hypothetical protein
MKRRNDRERYAHDELKAMRLSVWAIRLLIGLLLGFAIFALVLLMPG